MWCAQTGGVSWLNVLPVDRCEDYNTGDAYRSIVRPLPMMKDWSEGSRFGRRSAEQLD